MVLNGSTANLNALFLELGLVHVKRKLSFVFNLFKLKIVSYGIASVKMPQILTLNGI